MQAAHAITLLLPAADNWLQASATTRAYCACTLLQVAKHTPELAQLIVGAGGVAALVDYVGDSRGNNRLPGIMALGYIAAFSETLGLAVIAEKGLVSAAVFKSGVMLWINCHACSCTWYPGTLFGCSDVEARPQHLLLDETTRGALQGCKLLNMTLCSTVNADVKLRWATMI